MTEHKFTDGEIIRALGERTHSGKWIGKGFLDKQDFLLLISALDLINRQKAEIERLTERNFDLSEKGEKVCIAYKELSKKYELSFAEREANVKGFTKQLSRLKADIIKELAERLKATFPPREDARCTLDDCYTLDQIDNLVKEMTEEKTKI